MRLDTKAQISKFTLSALTVVTSIFILGVVVLVTCAGFQIDAFRETTTSFLLSAFGGLIGVAAVLVLLNVATSMSLIADAKIAELKIEPRRGQLRAWFIAFFATAAVLVMVIFVGTYYSKRRYLEVVRSQAEEVIRDNQGMLEEVATRMSSGKSEDYCRIADIRKFLEEQRADLPELTVIYSARFGEKQALYRIRNDYLGDAERKTFTPTYFPCTKGRDCDYLERFLSGNSVDALENYTYRNDQFYIYIPFVGKDARFILLFEKTESYGKIGS
jgi:hypothetical protein